MIYSLFDRIVDVILISNKNKTSYDALSVDVLFISSAFTDIGIIAKSIIDKIDINLLFIETPPFTLFIISKQLKFNLC